MDVDVICVLCVCVYIELAYLCFLRVNHAPPKRIFSIYLSGFAGSRIFKHMHTLLIELMKFSRQIASLVLIICNDLSLHYFLILTTE